MYLDEPVEFFDDAMAALRYMINDKLKTDGSTGYDDSIYEKGKGVKKKNTADPYGRTSSVF